MLELKLLGKSEVLRNGVPVTASVAAKPKALLAYLAVVARPVSRDVLASLFWGRSDQDAAAASLRQTLATLRKLGLDAWIETNRDSVRFNLDAPHLIDVAAFVTKCQEPRAKGQDDSSRLSALGSAVSLYRGDFLEGFNLNDAPEFEEWVVAQREHYRELALRALHTLAEAALSEGRYAESVDYARRILALDAWREEAHRLLMLGYARSGHRSAALAQYAECRRVLGKALGVPPSTETSALYERIRAAAQSARHNLPPQTTPFVGRQRELAHIEALLLNPECRMLTVLGIGGAGKTRLALQAAARCAEQFINGAWFVPLATVQAGALIRALADAVQCPLGGATEPKQRLLSFLREKELLLVLDNVEGLLDAASLFSELLRAAPDVKLLVTSRERLNLQAEWAFKLDGLEVPLAGREDASCAAMQLFEKGAQRTRASFALNATVLPAAGRICRLVEGLPLGIELASAWVRALDCAHIADEIQHNLDFLATTMRDVPEDQRSLRAVFDSSYRRLTAAEQRALARVSVFRGGFQEEAATAVLGPAARDVLINLMDKSLLWRDSNGRFELHELVRQYASEKLNPAELVAELHAGYFTEFLAAQQPLFRTAREHEAVKAVRIEADNLRQMWRSASQHARADLLDKALVSLYFMHEILGWYDEGIELFSIAIEHLASTPDSDAVRARLMTRRASLARSVGRYDEAERWFSDGLSLARAVGDELNQAYALRQLGYFPMVRGDIAGGLASMNESLRLYRAHHDLPRVADALMSVGIAQLRLGKMEQAVAMYQEAADILAEVGDEVGHAMAQDNLGDAAYYRGEFEIALRHYTAAADVQRRFDEHRQLAISQNNAADVLCQLQRWDEALVAAHESADLFREMSSRDGVVHALHSQAMALLGVGDLARASDCYAEMLTLGAQLHAEADLLNLLVLGGRLLAARGEYELAVQLLRFVQGNSASAAFTVAGADSALSELPREVVAPIAERAASSQMQTWTTAQAVENVMRVVGLAVIV